MGRRGLVAQDRARATREDGSHKPASGSREWMADRVDPLVDAVQLSAPHAHLDRARRKPHLEQLQASDNTVLAGGKRRDATIPGAPVRFRVTMPHKYTSSGHEAILHGLV
jgi:hypothetical protein